MSEKNADTTRLTPAMRRVLWLVGGVVAIALVVAVWLATAGRGGDTAPTPSATPTAGPLPGATPTTGSEVQDPAAGRPDLGRIPPLPVAAPLVSAPLPESATANRKLVEGFPAKIMGPAPDSDIVSSALATEGSVMQVTLVARTDASPESIVAHYRDVWAQLGLIDQGTTNGNGAAYASPHTSLTLAFSPESGTGTVYTILGSFRTE
ncbi:hypothetical protein [Microbacterium sp.]|uniref:hypothetical protein n=1 Tax=Microbacterium sp. TaxID=51671 RepID=UPI003221D548